LTLTGWLHQRRAPLRRRSGMTWTAGAAAPSAQIS